MQLDNQSDLNPQGHLLIVFQVRLLGDDWATKTSVLKFNRLMNSWVIAFGLARLLSG